MLSSQSREFHKFSLIVATTTLTVLAEFSFSREIILHKGFYASIVCSPCPLHSKCYGEEITTPP